MLEAELRQDLPPSIHSAQEAHSVKPKTTIVLAGRCDHDNYGDSLMFSFYARALQSSHNVALLNASDTFLERIREDGIEASTIYLNELSNAKELAGVIFVGGGYFGEPEIGKRKWSINFASGYFPKVLRILQNENIPYYIQGVEAGPISDPNVRMKIHDILANAQDVVVRNKASLDFCREIGVTTATYLPDVVLSGAKDFYSSNYENADSGTPKRYDVSIHVTGRLFSKNPLAKINLRSVLKAISKSNLSKVSFFFDQMENQERLLATAHRVAAKLQRNLDCDVIEYRGHHQLLKLLGNSAVVVTTKLHAGMTAISFGNKVLSISSAPKIKRFYRESGLAPYHCDYFWSLPRSKGLALKRVISEPVISASAADMDGSRKNITDIIRKQWKSFS